MTKCLIENASRSGVLENKLIGEAEAADKIRGKWIIQVAKHKLAQQRYTDFCPIVRPI